MPQKNKKLAQKCKKINGPLDNKMDNGTQENRINFVDSAFRISKSKNLSKSIGPLKKKMSGNKLETIGCSRNSANKLI